MNRKRSVWTFMLLAVFIFAVLAGCTPQKKPLPTQPVPAPPDKAPRMQVRPNPPKAPAVTGDTAADLTAKAMSVRGVRRANVIVLGNVAVVGIDTDTTKLTKNGSAVKDTVARKIAADPRVVRVYITTDQAISARIGSISDNMKKGRPTTEYWNQIDAIIKQIESKNK